MNCKIPAVILIMEKLLSQALIGTSTEKLGSCTVTTSIHRCQNIHMNKY